MRRLHGLLRRRRALPAEFSMREVDALAHPGEAQRLWTAVEARCPAASPFVRWPWVGAWLATYGADVAPSLLVVERGGGPPAGVALIGRRQLRRSGLFPVRQLYLNTAGELPEDSVCVEYNQLLCAEAEHQAVATALLRHLSLRRDWDELVLTGFLPEQLPQAGRLGREQVQRRPCYAMDLRPLRAQGLLPEQVLSSNTAAQIRRSLRLFGGRERVRLEEAGTLGEALAYLEELAALHQGAWTSRGEAGAFASPRFRVFMARLVRAGHPHAVQLLRLRDGAGQTVGVSLNLQARGTIYYYQSGLRQARDAREKPGLCLHLLAMEHALARGHDLYDFMASDARYKRSLSNCERTLLWTTIERPRARLWLEKLAVRSWRAVRRATSASSRPPPSSGP
jgi:CelD/BcsL family acetyltransferase involved in cellulose biosynthesis